MKQLRKKACDIPGSNHAGSGDVQEVVPLLVEDAMDITLEPVPINTVNISVSIRLNIKGGLVEIANHATPEVIKNTLTALQLLC